MKAYADGVFLSLDELKQVYACLLSYQEVCNSAFKSGVKQQLSADKMEQLRMARFAANRAVDIIEKVEKGD